MRRRPLTQPQTGARALHRRPHHTRRQGTSTCPAEQRGVAALVKALGAAGIDFRGLDVQRSSLEDIFVDLIGSEAP